MENTSFNDYTVCSICFEIQNEMIPLYTEEFRNPLFEKLLKFTKINLHIEDSRKFSICRQCFRELKTCVQFLTKCMSASEILKHANCTDNDLHVNSESSNVCETEQHNEAQVTHEEDKHTQNINEKGILLSCQFCSKVFTRKFNLKCHELRHVSPFSAPAGRYTRPPPARVCPHCAKSYTSYTNLKTHMRTHTGERPYVCSECGKAFGSKKILTEHMRTHTGVKPYMCPICGKQFTTNKLSTHMRRHKTVPSTGLTQTLPSSTHASETVNAHAGETVNTRRAECACSLCPARYNHKQSLNKHIRKFHGLNPSDLCKRNENGIIEFT